MNIKFLLKIDYTAIFTPLSLQLTIFFAITRHHRQLSTTSTCLAICQLRYTVLSHSPILIRAVR